MAKKYPAIEVQQQPGAPKMYLLSVPAPELLEWCDVPRTKEHYMAGYQRLLADDRANKITKYLEFDANNILPGAIIVAADPQYVSVQKSESGCFLEVADDLRSFDEKLAELFGAFSSRLTAEELKSVSISVSVPDEDEDDGPDDEEYDAPKSYLAQLTGELQAAVTDWEALGADRQDAIRDYIEGISKPGLIIDGQHRVIGSKNVSKHDVNLPIILIHGLSHMEQVFQFYVLNSKAQPLKATELRRIVSTSLSGEEIESLFTRFKQSRVDLTQAQWTYQMNTRDESVFKGLIDFGFGAQGSFIEENVADQIVRNFMLMPKKRYHSLIEGALDRWGDPDERLKLFFDFWRSVASFYKDIWAVAVRESKPGSPHQMLKKVSLITLQKFILDRFVTALPYRGKSAPPPFSSAEAVQEMVESTLANLPADFFSREWKQSQMDTSEGRRILYDSMSQVWDNAGKNIGNMKLFRG